MSGTYQFTRGVQTGGAGGGPRHVDGACSGGHAGARLSAVGGCASGEIISLIQPGTEYGSFNLNQVDLRASKRFKFAQYRFRLEFDSYNVFNTNWPFTVTNTFSTLASSQWLRPTNVLQARFFKLGAQFDF